MKKTIKISLVGAILASGLMAADTSSLTRATVKLIQNQNEINKSIDELRSLSNTTSSVGTYQGDKITEHEEKISLIQSDILDKDQKLLDIGNKYKLLVGDIEQVKSDAEKAIAVSNHTAKVLEELAKVSSLVKEKSDLVESATNTISVNNNDIKKDIAKIDKTLLNIGKLSESNSKNIDKNTLSISKLESELRALKIQIEKQNNLIDEKFNSLKVVYDSEINIIKVQLEKARPILITETSNVSASDISKATNCVSVSKEEEELIADFLGR